MSIQTNSTYSFPALAPWGELRLLTKTTPMSLVRSAALVKPVFASQLANISPKC